MTKAEERAVLAENLSAFSGIKLSHLRSGLANLLALIGRDGVFDQYTRHDISHIDAMLSSLEWLIPDSSKDVMSTADWLMIVLSIYLHDLGMLVTQKEYESRSNSSFPQFKSSALLGGAAAANYRAKVLQLPPERAERFLYQEFVRYKHAERIRSWIMGKASDYLGVATRAMAEVDRLLDPLPRPFRRDLALVCESHHHLDDLYDFDKYKVSQPYGNSLAETANVHYAAILLRAADLLHVTSDRTPSVAFRLIDPTDPISQEEWTKQMAVTSVRAKLGLDREGVPDSSAPRDTIEVHAYFRNADGFFGLTSYLKYAQEQFRKNYEWAQLAIKHQGVKHQFPWRFIDDSGIETGGFLRQTF